MAISIILKKSEQSLEWLARSSSDKIGSFQVSAPVGHIVRPPLHNFTITKYEREECSGLAVKCLTVGRAVVCLNLTGVTTCVLEQNAFIFA